MARVGGASFVEEEQEFRPNVARNIRMPFISERQLSEFSRNSKFRARMSL